VRVRTSILPEPLLSFSAAVLKMMKSANDRG
jgi:hypothetical protein